MAQRNSKIFPVHLEEAALLRALFAERTTLTQEEFCVVFGLGSQAMVWQYLNARSPLNLEAAIYFSRGPQCKIAEFSPRLSALWHLAYDFQAVTRK